MNTDGVVAPVDAAAVLGKHRLARIERREIRSRYPREVGKNARLGVHGWGPTSCVRVLTTDQGASGWGLSWGDDVVLASLLGRALTDLFDPDSGVVAEPAMPLDFALHDLAGTILGVPVYRLLGGHGPTAIPCYDGAIYMDDLMPEEAPRGKSIVLANCAADHALGYRAFKLKVGRGHRWMESAQGVERDIAVTRAVRDAFPECEILVDGNDGFTRETLGRYIEAVADCRVYWIEEPFRESADDFRWLRALLEAHSAHARIADGESAPEIAEIERLAAGKLLDVAIMDIAGFGFTSWRRWMPRAIALGVAASPHTWGDPLKTYYAAHLAAGLGNVLTLEGIPATSDDVDWTGFDLAAGALHVPDRPGFGMDLVAR